LPRKNILPLGGKPLLSWTITAALDAGLFDRVWVSSEDSQILDVAEAWGGTALQRPPELAADHVTVVQICLQAVEGLTADGYSYSDLYVLLPTSPFRKASTIKRAWDAYRESGADFLMSITPLDHPPQWALVQRDGWLIPLHPEHYETPRQGLVPSFRHDGGHAIGKISEFLNRRSFLGPRMLPFPVPAEEVLDVDEPVDLAWAEFLLHRAAKKR
jgi:CMP-N-acetylneuraminic acid synthetase